MKFGANKETTSPLPPGSYVIKLKEQVNEDSTFRLRTDDCQGGFIYYEIPVEVTYENGLFRASINPSHIIKDPDNVENEYLEENTNFSALPCVKWKRIVNGEEQFIEDEPPSPGDECVEYATAIGPFGTSPTGLITSLGRWLLSIASAAAIGWLVYAGYVILTSRGDKEKIANAREIITSAVTGLIFLVLSITILEIIGVDILQIPGFTR
jgi:hypothetical protein